MQDMIVAKLRTIPGVNLAEPQGAFYVLPEMGAFFGPGRLEGVTCVGLLNACVLDRLHTLSRSQTHLPVK